VAGRNTGVSPLRFASVEMTKVLGASVEMMRFWLVVDRTDVRVRDRMTHDW